MKKHEKEILRIEEALIRFHRRPVTPRVGDHWKTRLMARVRVESENAAVFPNNLGFFSGTVWRFAAVTCVVAVLLAVYASGVNVDAQFQVAELILDEPAGVELALLFASL